MKKDPLRSAISVILVDRDHRYVHPKDERMMWKTAVRIMKLISDDRSLRRMYGTRLLAHMGYSVKGLKPMYTFKDKP